ncbi:mandelate racemase/muconate lactonizing enzyme family protein [Streptomonospora litoralis]|uniref:glucarate dehydratase n=1 Tax=Streptomonospora litoralis TaxID=2498135 RepID=A0A4P6Q2K8_9ACTN|nr:enolase C-terminal domain-like protein [Streptomonospora litoralis]QBI53014.1 Glucarate dehydratase [Streptomonospora litoralis]
MRIVNVEAFSVAIPFRNPIESAYGVSYPARIRVIVRLTTDEGITGIGETGPSAVHHVHRDDLAPRFLRDYEHLILGADPFHSADLMRAAGYTPDAVAIETACLDIVGKATGRRVCEILGANEPPASVPVALYSFFRLPDRDGAGAVTPQNLVETTAAAAEEAGTDTVKLKLGVHEPRVEVDLTRRLREAMPTAAIRIDPNGAWSTATALNAMRRLEELDLEYVEDPIKDSPLGFAQQIITGRSIDVPGMRRLRMSTRTPLCADNSYRLDLLRQVIAGEAADVVLADVFGCGGLRGTVRWYQAADLFHLGLGMHSGTETGIGQVAKIHVVAAMEGRVGHPMDAIYPEYTGDVLAGEPPRIRGGAMEVPKGPGLGIELDSDRLERYELTAQRHAELDDYWAEAKAAKGIGSAQASMLVRGF